MPSGSSPTYHWLSLSEFIDIFTISQMTPGPIGINAATFAGMKIAGIGGAVCATMGFVTPSIFLCIALAKIIFKYGDLGAIHGILNGLRPAVMALIAAACVSFVLLAVCLERRTNAQRFTRHVRLERRGDFNRSVGGSPHENRRDKSFACKRRGRFDFRIGGNVTLRTSIFLEPVI